MVNKSPAYHDVLNVLDAGQTDLAAHRLFEEMIERQISRFEFRLLLNAFIRRGKSLTTA